MNNTKVFLFGALQSEAPVIFQNLEMLRLRQQAAKTFGIEAGNEQTADYVNSLTKDELLAIIKEKR